MPDVRNNEQLFRDLVAAHGKRLYGFVLKHIGHSDDAEELAQQAFVEAACSIETFRGASELSTWLYGIAMNLVRNYLSRSPHRVYRIEGEEALADLPDHAGGPDDQVDHNRTAARLMRELDMLPPEMREVLVLVAIDELSYEEAAAMLSIPIGTVRSRVSRARATLRHRLERSYAVS